MHVIGKGEKERKVPVPGELIDEFGDELALAGRSRDVLSPDNASIPILAKFTIHKDEADPAGWSASGLHKSISTFMARTAEKMDPAEASAVRQATTHWLRHTHASHAVNGRDGHSPVPVVIVQANLGHASIGTTSGYLKTERDKRLQAMEGFWRKSGK